MTLPYLITLNAALKNEIHTAIGSRTCRDTRVEYTPSVTDKNGRFTWDLNTHWSPVPERFGQDERYICGAYC